MGGVNTRLVQRSWGIFQSRTDSDQAYGPNFSYDEFGQTRGAFAAIAFSAVFIAFVTLVFSFRPVSVCQYAVISIFLIFCEGPLVGQKIRSCAGSWADACVSL
jgi:hypothetical protein